MRFTRWSPILATVTTSAISTFTAPPITRAGLRPTPHNRSWLDTAGTLIAVQHKLMRHSDTRATLNVYGDVVTDEMAQANSRVTKMALFAGQLISE
jgi:hypothetical protein